MCKQDDYSEGLLDYLYPGNAVKPIEENSKYTDYSLVSILASHGYVIRNMEPQGLFVRVTAYKCLDGNHCDSVQFGVYPIEDREDANREDYLFSCRHGSNLIVRYYKNGNGSYSRPVWHTLYSGLYANRDYKCYSLSLL